MTNKRLCTAICVAIVTMGMMSGCGNVDDTSSANPKTTSADSLASSDNSFAETSKKSVTITTSSSDDSSSKVTTTSIVTGTDRNGNVTTLIIGEGGKILSTFKNGSATSKTTTKADVKTTTTKRSGSNVDQNNNGGNTNNGGNSGDNSGYDPPAQTDPPQTEPPKTTTQKPEPKPTQTTTEKPNFKDLPIEEKINSCNFDDLTTAYLKFGCGKANIEISDYEWQLIRQDMIDYGFENIEGKTEFFREDPFGDYTITFPYPVHLIVNESYEGESHAHYDVWTSEYFYGGYYSGVLKAENEEQMLEVAEKVRNSVRPTLEWAVESFYWTTDSTGAYDDPDIAEIACTIEYNFGMMDDGSVWFLTE